MKYANLIPFLLLFCWSCSSNDQDDDWGEYDEPSDATEGASGNDGDDDPSDGADGGDENGGNAGSGTSVFTVEEACETSDYGYGSPTPDAKEGLARTNCFRNLMGLEPAVLHPILDAASQAHSDYMQDNDILSHSEESSKPGYTGDAVWDRIESAGYPLEGGRSWAEIISWGYSAADAVDGWVQTVYHRIPFTTPYIVEVGFGQTGSYSSMTFVSPYPNGERTAVVYPIDGQRDVPIDFDSDSEWPDPAPSHGVVGYPVTVTVSSNSAAGGNNDYGLYLLDATLVDSNGTTVDCIVADPSEDEWLGNTAFMLPKAPLSRNTTYTATMVVEWGGVEETLTARFTTGSE